MTSQPTIREVDHAVYMREFRRRADHVERILIRMSQKPPYIRNAAERIVRWAEDGFEGEP